jgi:hypothetical protein
MDGTSPRNFFLSSLSKIAQIKLSSNHRPALTNGVGLKGHGAQRIRPNAMRKGDYLGSRKVSIT